jgi:hypothetical protein
MTWAVVIASRYEILQSTASVALGQSDRTSGCEVLAANIHRVRTAQRLGFAELFRLLSDVGRPIPELGLRRKEKGERRDLAA